VTVALAVDATHDAIGQNTNLGILLLLTPLAATARGLPIRSVENVLRELTVEDARRVFKAIRLANPGGLGDAPEQDVREEPTVTLLEAMKLAADRDMVARQYANGFADVFDFGVPAFLAGFERFGRVEAAIIDSQLRWLAEYPDSLIARKNGPAVAADVQKRAREVLDIGGIATPEGRRAGVELDRHLRSDGNKLNPGTTADLITACLFVALRENKVAPSAPFRWNVPDWL
jgi:triphosphoribosyl-dephospho-CoA synthase